MPKLNLTDLTEDRHHEILNEIGNGTRTDLDDLEDFRCPGKWASELIAAASKQNWEAVYLPCQVDGDLTVLGDVSGDLTVVGDVSGDLTVDGDVSGTLTVHGKVSGGLRVLAT